MNCQNYHNHTDSASFYNLNFLYSEYLTFSKILLLNSNSLKSPYNNIGGRGFVYPGITSDIT